MRQLIYILAPLTVAAGSQVSAQVPPTGFVENRGQFDAQARFVQGLPGGTVFVTDDGFRVSLSAGLALFYEFSFDGWEERPQAVGRGVGEARFHYFRGNDPSRWVRDARSYRSVVLEGVGPGIDVHLYVEGRGVTFDVHCEPGVDASGLVLRVRGADATRVVADGGLALETVLGRLEQTAPRAFRVDAEGTSSPVPCGVVACEEDTFRFVSEDLDGESRLIIDPTVLFSTFLGGSGTGDTALDIWISNAGEIVVTGGVDSPDFPVTPGAFQTSHAGTASDAFLAKLKPGGGALEFATYLGGVHYEASSSLFVAEDGSFVLAGATESVDFPVTAGVAQPLLAGKVDAFVSRISADGSALLASTFVGGLEVDLGWDVAFDPSGGVYVAGHTTSTDFPTTAGTYDPVGDGFDAFLMRMDLGLSAIVSSTTVGTSGSATFVGLDPLGFPVVAGQGGPGFPVTVGAFQTTSGLGGGDLVCARLTPDLSSVTFGTFIGGASAEGNVDAALTLDGDIVITASSGPLFPTTPGAYDELPNGNTDAVVARLDSTGSSLVYSTYIAGSGADAPFGGLALDANDAVYVHGQTTSVTFPVTSDAFQPKLLGQQDCFLSKLDPTGSRLLFSTYWGGAQIAFENAHALGVGPNFEVVAGGLSWASDFPTTAGAYDTTPDVAEGFLSAFDLCGGSFTSFGAGCAGTGGLAPTLSGTGCPTPRRTVGIELENGAPGAFGILVFGGGHAAVPIVASCALQIGPIFPAPVLSYVLPSGGTNAGSLSLSGMLPPDVPPATLYVQAAIADPAAQDGVAASNALQIVVDY